MKIYCISIFIYLYITKNESWLIICKVLLTPAKQNVYVEALALFECGDEDEVMKVEALNEDPGIVSHDDVVKHGKDQLTRPVLQQNKHTRLGILH